MKYKLLLIIFFYLNYLSGFGQKSDYTIIYTLGKDTDLPQLNLKAAVASRTEAQKYINGLAKDLLIQGFPAASVDSVSYADSSAFVYLYIGPYARQVKFSAGAHEFSLLQAKPVVEGSDSFFISNSADWYRKREQLLNVFDNTGFPFANFEIQQPVLHNDTLTGILRIDKGYEYPCLLYTSPSPRD